MPPKKVATPKSPAVVGTVSTRSTKRESVVNIEIIPKPTKSVRRSNNKSPRGTSKPERISPRKGAKSAASQIGKSDVSDDGSEKSTKKNPAILDLLKDWSDEDSNSSPNSIVPVSSESSSDYRIVFEETMSPEKPNSLSADQQNLIEILEGMSQSSPPVTKHSLLGNNFANSGSIEIIEESVIEDNAIIIESSEDTSNSVGELENRQYEKDSTDETESKKPENENTEKTSVETEVEIVQNKYKYSEIPLHLRGKPRADTEKLPVKKRLLHVVLEKNITDKSKDLVEASSFQTKVTPTTVDTAMEVDQPESAEVVNKMEHVNFNEAEGQIIDNTIEMVEETIVDFTENINSNSEEVIETSEEVPLENIEKSDTGELSKIEEVVLNENIIKLGDMTMEMCEEQVINEEVIGDAKDDNLDVELTQSSVKEESKKGDQSFVKSVEDLERILADEPEESKDIDMEKNEKEALAAKRGKKIGKTEENLQFSSEPSKLKPSPSKKSCVIDMPTLEDTSPSKKLFSEALSQLDVFPSTPKSKKSPRALQRSVSDISPRTRRSQKSLNSTFGTSNQSKDNLDNFNSVRPGKLKKSVSETSVIETSKDDHKKKNVQCNLSEMDIEDKHKGLLENITETAKTKTDSSDIDKIDFHSKCEEVSDKTSSSLVSISSKSKIELKKNIDLKCDANVTKLNSPAEILENIYYPKPSGQVILTKTNLKSSSADKGVKNVPKLQTHEDILASIYNPKPIMTSSQMSSSDSNSSDKKENEPSTPIAESTFDFEEISSSSSSETKKSQDKFEEKEFSEYENIGDVSSSFGDLSLNAEKKPRGRAKKPPKKGTRKSFRKKEQEDLKIQEEKMDTSDLTEDSSNSGNQMENLGDTEMKSLEEPSLFSQSRLKPPKLSKKTPKEGKIEKEQKTKTSKESKKKKKENEELDNKRSQSAEDLRRSSRIKTIVPVKKKSHGLVKSKSEPILNESDVSDTSSINESEKSSTPTASPKPVVKERKTRWSSAKETLPISPLAKTDNGTTNTVNTMNFKPITSSANAAAIIKQRMKGFIHLKENQFKTDRQISKEAKEMICDCYLAEEDIQKNEFGCGEDCLNRLLMIECGDLCQVGSRCTNKKFQKGQMAPVEVFHTDKKGLGIKAAANIPYGEFILEYVGEVLGKEEFDKRAEIYSEDKNIHHYFMSLRPDAIIDATVKGNISRFINHSCEPNAETQKWTVNGELRIGFFSTRTILAGEEITFDYQFERYGREAQKCYCEAPSCRGWLGDSPDASEDEEEEEDTQKIPDKAVKKDDLISQSIESAISAALAKEFGPEAPETVTTETTDIEKKISETASPTTVTPEVPPTPAKPKKKIRKDIFEDLDQLKEELEMLATTGLKNQQHTLKLSRLMVRAKDPEQRKKLLHILRRGELACRRLFLDYHGLRLIHGYIVDAEQLAKADPQFNSSKLELLQTLAVLPIQNKTILIESKVLPAVEQMAAKNDGKSKKESANDTEEEIRFLAKKLLEGWTNLKQSFRIPKKQRIEQMKEHEKEANKKFMESRSRMEEDNNYRKTDTRYRSSWSRYKSERESSSKKIGSKPEDKDKDKPSAEFLRISKQERRKLFALQMELKEHERRLKQREMWRQHEMNCMMIGADPRFTAPFDPTKGFQYVWNPSIGQWQALPAPITQTEDVFPGSQGSQAGAQNWAAYPGQSMISTIPMLPSTHAQLPGLNIPGLQAIPPDVSQTQPPLPQTPPIFLDIKKEEVDLTQVKFAGPIPPPAKLPPKWKCAKDKYGRPYYYHTKIRKSQWEPPPLPEDVKLPESPSESSSSETSSLSSDTSSGSDSEGDMDDDKLLFEVRKQIETNQKINQIKKEVALTPSPDIKAENSEEDDTFDQSDLTLSQAEESKELSWLDIRLKEQFNLEADESPPQKKKRIGLCTEIIISPRTEEDRLQFKEDVKRYKANKEKLKRQKELQLQKSKQKRKLKVVLDESETRKLKDKHLRISAKHKMKEIQSAGDDAKKIKETFRTNLAGTVVSVLNAYRKPDCKVARIVNTEDFKHLARKLTHFVMLKELKHLDRIEDLTCTESVKAKAREYIKKYMSKFGELYYKRHDEPDFRD